MVHGYIEEVAQRGMYALVDGHQLSPGDPDYDTARIRKGAGKRVPHGHRP